MSAWWIVLGMGVATMAVRMSFIFLPPNTHVPAWLRRALRYVGVAVLPALIVPEVLFRSTSLGQPFDVLKLLAALVAGLVAWRTRSIVWTLVSGLLVLHLLRWWIT